MSFPAEKLLKLREQLLAADPESGASLCVIVNGQEVFHETWGQARAAEGVAYTADTLQITMSMAKGVVATLLAILIDRGQLEPDAPVSQYWPEFAAAGKGSITVAQLFSHQAGLPLLDGGLSAALAANREALASALAAQAPQWAPGTQHGYHAVTFGNYADILFERVSGKTLCELLAELMPQMDAEVFCGLPPQHWGRVATVLPPLPPPTGTPVPAAPAIDAASLPIRVLTNTPELVVNGAQFLNGEAIRSICLPGTNMFSNARSLARMYAGLLAGGVWNRQRLCSPEAIAAVRRERVRGIDLVNGMEMAYGLGFQLPSAFSPFAVNRKAFGHLGFGGSIAFADPERGLALAWMPSRYAPHPYDTRMQAVLQAVNDATSARNRNAY